MTSKLNLNPVWRIFLIFRQMLCFTCDFRTNSTPQQVWSDNMLRPSLACPMRLMYIDRYAKGFRFWSEMSPQVCLLFVKLALKIANINQSIVQNNISIIWQFYCSNCFTHQNFRSGHNFKATIKINGRKDTWNKTGLYQTSCSRRRSYPKLL